MQFPANNQRGRCAYCGKEIAIKDIRDMRPRYCSRAHASMGRYRTRYTGGGRQDVPNLQKKIDNL
jgi:hypothetical protein